MNLIYRIFTTFAAVLILIIGGSWLSHQYSIGPNFGWWKEHDWRSQYFRSRDEDGVPAKTLAIKPGEVMISVPSFDRGSFWESSDSYLILPVFYGSPHVLGGSFGPYGLGGYQRSGGSCRENIINLVVIGKETPEGKPVFENRVYLPRYFFFKSETETLVAALIVNKDTNQDGKLDCGDEAVFKTMSLASGEIKTTSRVFIADNATKISYDGNKDEFIFYEVLYTDDNLSLQSIRISREDLSISEDIAPDLVSKSHDAFNTLDSE